MLHKPARAMISIGSALAICAVAANVLIGSPEVASAEQWSLRALMVELAKTRSGSVRYREERHLKTMTEPVVVTGTMAYQAPDRLVKTALTPQKETMVIEGDNLTIDREGGVGVQSLKLSEIPQLSSLITALRATLLGDRAALQRHFEVRVRGTRTAWSMDLTPRTGGARGSGLRITVEGAAGRPGRFEIRQPDGDRIVVQVFEK